MGLAAFHIETNICCSDRVMRVLGLDPGVKSLAACIYDSENKKILYWHVADLSKGKATVAERILTWLEETPEFLDCSHVCIERQPARAANLV